MSNIAINLQKYNLKEPTAISKLDFKEVKNAIVEDIKKALPNINLVESDIFMVLVETFAYRELHLRNLINEDIKKMLPHYSSGADLDNFMFAFFGGVQRLEGEDDISFLQRGKMSLNSYSSAGAAATYEFYTKSFNSSIYDCKAYFKSPGVVEIIYVVSDEGLVDSEELLDFLSDEKIRPLTDFVEVREATKINIDLNAVVTIFDRNSSEDIKNTIQKNFTNRFYIGETVIFSKLIDLLHINGVYKVDVNLEKEDIAIQKDAVAIINLTLNMESKNG